MSNTTTEHPAHRGFVPPKLPKPINPALAKHYEARAASVQNRIADAITRFAGSMAFVYFHVLWFAVWIIFGIEGYPFGLLTMIVSLEAIFLSTFVMISQNRADFKRQAAADLQLIELSNQILELTKLIHARTQAPQSVKQ
jgi:uncharacterized membrane protein